MSKQEIALVAFVFIFTAIGAFFLAVYFKRRAEGRKPWFLSEKELRTVERRGK